MGQLAAGPAQDESYESEYVGKNQVLDALASDRGGLYVGPTSAATLLIVSCRLYQRTDNSSTQPMAV